MDHSLFIERVDASIFLTGHFLDTSIGEYIGKGVIIAVDGRLLVLKPPH